MTTSVAGEVWIVAERRRMKASDLNEVAIVAYLLRRGLHEPKQPGRPWTPRWADGWTMANDWQVPWAVLNAKLTRMKRRGVVDGCECGCRGDWHLSDATLDLLAGPDPGFTSYPLRVCRV